MALPTFVSSRAKQVIRAASSPLDKTTLVSIYPREIDEVKHTLSPGRFIIPAGSYEKPSILVVGSSSWWKEMPEDQPDLEITNHSIQIAKSVIDDYCNGLLGCNMGESMPGLFFVPGSFSLDYILKTHSKDLNEAKARQKNWYSELVKLADILWARTNGNPISIGDDMRLAAQELQIKDKPWMQDFTTLQLVNCPACGTLRNNAYPVCNSCHNVIDKVKYKELGLELAR